MTEFKSTLKLISAGAGSGKTYRLTQELTDLLTEGNIRPSGLIATTFTKRAAAELRERVRVALLERGLTTAANELTNALIGTVHGLGVKLLRRFAYEAGVSPQVEIIAEGDGQRIFNLSMAAVIDLDRIERIEQLCEKLALSRNGEQYNWRRDVLGLVEIIRGNNFDDAAIATSKEKSWTSLEAFLPGGPAPTLPQYQQRIEIALQETAQTLYQNEADGTKKTLTAAGKLRSLLSELQRRGFLPWVEYAKLGRYEKEVGAKSRALVEHLVELGRQHASLTEFHADMRTYQDLLFDCARDAIEEYDRYKKSRGRIDYTDMEVLVLRLLEHPTVIDTLKRELDLLMVDEFQDTSPIQLAIFLRLSQLANRSIWVGDPKQSIYGFRGAEPRLMAAVMAATGPVDPANIQTKSWRSREDIVYACNSLFTEAFPEIDREAVALEPVRTRTGSKFYAAEAPSLSERSGLIHWHFQPEGKTRYSIAWMQGVLAKAVRELLADPPPVRPKGTNTERPLRAGDIAVLCRSNYGCAAMAKALAKEGIPAAIARTGLLQTAEATLLLACMKYLLSSADSLSIAEIMLFGSRRSLGEIVTDRLQYLATDPENRPKWGEDNELLRRLRILREITTGQSTSELLNLLLEHLDLRRTIVAWGDGEQRLSNVDELRRLAVAYEENCHRQHRAASLGGYLLYLDELGREDEDYQGASEREDAVNVLTYHRSKGLEWPAVVCFNLDQPLRASVWGRAVVPETDTVNLARPLADRWLRYWVNPYDRLSTGVPWVEALRESEVQAHAEAEARAEEARLLYVGFTRARDYLILPTAQKKGAPWVDRVYARGGTVTTVLSPDTHETPFIWSGHEVDKYTKTWIEPASQPVTEMRTREIPFIRGQRPGRSVHPPKKAEQDWLAEHFSADGNWLPAYYTLPDLDPETDFRLYARCVSRLAQGFAVADPAYRLELAEQLLKNIQPGGMPDPAALVAQVVAWYEFLDTHYPKASFQKAVPLNGQVLDRHYTGQLDWWAASMPSVLIREVHLSTRQLKKALNTELAELRLQVNLLLQQGRPPVETALLHVPAAARCIALIQ